MEALSSATAKLPLVEIKKPQNIVGITTVDNIQGGLYYGAVGMAREILNKITHEYFQGQPVRLIATGGFSSLFKAEQDLFEIIEPDLILMGLWQFYLTIRED